MSKLADLIPDIDLASDEAWEPVFNPYEGRVTPSWKITQEARYRMSPTALAAKPDGGTNE